MKPFLKFSGELLCGMAIVLLVWVYFPKVAHSLMVWESHYDILPSSNEYEPGTHECHE